MPQRENAIIWLIGLSGSGKTTTGRLVFEALRRADPATVFLDGDILREVWGGDLGHTIEGRRVNAERISRLCRMLDRQGITVVASVLSIFPDWQQWNRDNLSRYFEVFLDAPLDVLRERKPLYREAEAGRMRDVVGVDIPFPAPPHPDLAADTSGRDGTPEEIAARIVDAARARFSGMPPEPSRG